MTPEVSRPAARPIPDWAAAELNALDWTRWLGFRVARRTKAGADKGLDIEGPGVFGQVKFHGKAIPPNLVQQLFGARGRRDGQLLFFSNSGYTRAALDCADDLDIACFQYSPADGAITASNIHARALMAAAHSTSAPASECGAEPASTRASAVLPDHRYAEFSYDGSLVAYLNPQGVVHVDSFPGGAPIARFDPRGRVMGLEFVDQSAVAIHLPFRDYTVIWDARSGLVRRTIGERREHDTVVYMRHIVSGGELLGARELPNDPPDRWVLYSTRTGQRVTAIEAVDEEDSIVAWSVSPAEHVQVACICRTHATSRSWHLRIGQSTHQIAPGDRDGVLHHFAFTPDGKLMAAVGESACVDLWDVTQGERTASLPPGNGLDEDDSLTAVAIGAQGRLLAVGACDHTIHIWNLETHEEVAVLEGHKEEITKISFSPDGRHLLSSGDDGPTRWWSLQDVMHTP